MDVLLESNEESSKDQLGVRDQQRQPVCQGRILLENKCQKDLAVQD